MTTNTSWNIVNFRRGLLLALRRQGVDVVAVSPYDAYSSRLADIGCRHVPLVIDNKGTNPFGDAALLARYIEILRHEKPDVILSWTIKPNVYGSLAARVLRIPVINNVSGLGTAFLSDAWMQVLVKALYRIALAQSARVFFQNRDDLRLFVNAGLVSDARAALLPGSGVDLERFSPVDPALGRGRANPSFLLVGRLLWDKGIGEYVDAARKVKAIVPGAQFKLLGFLDVKNRTAVPRSTVDSWVHEGVVDYLGSTDDVRPYIADADCVVLPSYREGTPRSLLEAAAMGRPLVATDVPGCRDIVEDGVNGWLCKPRDANDLAEKILRIVRSPSSVLLAMGRESRLKAEKSFGESVVVQSYLEAIDSALRPRVKLP